MEMGVDPMVEPGVVGVRGYRRRLRPHLPQVPDQRPQDQLIAQVAGAEPAGDDDAGAGRIRNGDRG